MHVRASIVVLQLALVGAGPTRASPVPTLRVRLELCSAPFTTCVFRGPAHNTRPYPSHCDTAGVLAALSSIVFEAWLCFPIVRCYHSVLSLLQVALCMTWFGEFCLGCVYCTICTTSLFMVLVK